MHALYNTVARTDLFLVSPFLNMLEVRTMVDHVRPSWPKSRVFGIAGAKAVFESKTGIHAER